MAGINFKGGTSKLLGGLNEPELDEMPLDFVEAELDSGEKVPSCMRHIDLSLGIALGEEVIDGLQLTHSFDAVRGIRLERLDFTVAGGLVDEVTLSLETFVLF